MCAMDGDEIRQTVIGVIHGQVSDFDMIAVMKEDVCCYSFRWQPLSIRYSSLTVEMFPRESTDYCDVGNCAQSLACPAICGL